MRKIWYSIFEINGLVVFPVVATFLVYGTGRAILAGDGVFFAETLALFLACITLEMILGILEG